MDATRALRRMVRILVVGGLTLIILLFSVIQPQANSQAADNTGTPYVTFTPGLHGIAPGGIPVTPTVGPTPLPPPPTLAPTGKKPPACTFPLAQTMTTEPVSVDYTFSDPKPISLNSSWGEINFYQWLPDNRRILVGHKDKIDQDNPDRDDPPQIIGVYDPGTGENQDFGSRFAPTNARPPVWIARLNGVVYPESVGLTPSTLRPDGQGWLPLDSADFQRRLWFSRGDPAALKTLEDERVTVDYASPSKFGPEFAVATSPDGSEIVYLDSVGRQLYMQSVVQGAFQRMPAPSFDVTQWTYRVPNDPSLQNWWSMTWRPNSTQVLLYSIDFSFDTGYTFLLNVASGLVCELNLLEDDSGLGQSSGPAQAHWSPNGRYLAVVKEKVDPPIHSSDLTVLDTVTGKLYKFDSAKLTPAGLEQNGYHLITNFAWAPDNRHLAALWEVVYCTMNCIEWQMPSAYRLLLLDLLTGQSVPISTAELELYVGWPSHALLWSDDGSRLIVPAVGGPYLLSVEKRAQRDR